MPSCGIPIVNDSGATMNVLVAGLGSIGMRHSRNYKALGCGVSGFDPSEARRKTFEDEIGGVAFDSYELALSSGPDLVAITSPNIYHMPQAFAAVRSGCRALFIEKPLGTDLAEAREFAALAKETGCYVHVGSNWKFHPAFQRMKSWLADGRLGIVTGAQVLAGQWLPDWHPWEDYRQMYAARKSLGGGAIFDTHELDYLRWLLGPIQSFNGFKAHSGALETETEDVAACVMRFKGGVLGVLLTDYIQRVGRRRYHVSGSEGTMEWDLSTNRLVFSRSGTPKAEVVDTKVDDLNQMYLDQSRRILEDLQTGGRPVTSLGDMLEVLELQTAWHSSECLEREAGTNA